MRLAEAIKPAGPGKPCSVGELLAKLADTDPELRDDLTEWLDGTGPDWSDRVVWQALQDLGHRVGKQTIGHHRRGTCRCR